MKISNNILLIVLSFFMLNIPVLYGQNFVKSKIVSGDVRTGETYQSLTFDGAWCWFSDPRAIYYEGIHQRTYSAWVDSYGDIQIGFYDHQTKEINTKVLFDRFEVDDHDNPAILFDSNGHLLVFFTKHAAKDPICLVRSSIPESIEEWEPIEQLAINDTNAYKGMKDSYTYANPVRLTEEGNRIYLFWRGMDFKPNYSFSDDNGKSWADGKILILPERKYANRRPYVKVSSNGKDKIHIAFTDGHPRMEPNNSIYYVCYKNGAFYKANGEKIKDVSELPFEPRETSVVYDAVKTNQKAWIWDVAEDERGQPVLVFSKFPDDETHIYCYARFDGNKWLTYDLVNSGRWFPKTPEGEVEREPNYSGGIILDHENPNIVYLSANRDSVFEIEKWTTSNGGKSWTVNPITKASEKDNVRPFAVRGAKEDNPLQVLWMVNTKYIHYTDYQSAIKSNIYNPVDNTFKKESIKNVMRKVADWQLANPKEEHKLNWHYGAFYTGLMALYKTTGEERYYNEMVNLGQKHNWKLLNDIYHADRLTIAQVFTDIYLDKKEPEMLEKIQWVLDMHIDRNPQADVRYHDNDYALEWWTWCDALYMAPPTFMRVYKATGDEKYMNYMDEHWWKTSDYLYSKEDSLFFRDDRFFEDKSKNGKKVFWCRGNGWVIAGLARVMDYMPKDYPSRKKYETQFKEMAAKLLRIQDEDGLWRASLDDPEELPIGESSGSAFFCFALTWGINNGLLPEEQYGTAVKKAWTALVNNINEEGRLGYVQQVAGSPYPFYDNQWHVYASGAFLLAGAEMIKYLD